MAAEQAQMDFQARQASLRQWAEEEGVDGLIVASASNIRYLTGFRGEGLLFAGCRMLLATDGRYEAEAAEAVAEAEVRPQQGHLETLADMLKAAGVKKAAFESDRLTHHQWSRLREKLPDVELVPVRGVVEKFRQVKDAAEIQLIAAAAEITSRVADRVFSQAAEGGLSERLWAVEIYRMFVEEGAEGPAFDTIVAAGANSAEPHHASDETPVEAPGALKLDLGARLAGYCADLTRTGWLGDAAPDEFKAIYRAVYDAQQAALEFVRAGVRAAEVDAAARRVIEQAGYGKQFVHGLGHGVGLDVHERPALSSNSEDVLEAGMVVTIEPGIYLPGRFGVRIEDLVVVEEDGCRVLTSANKPAPDEL